MISSQTRILSIVKKPQSDNKKTCIYNSINPIFFLIRSDIIEFLQPDI
jgi:hypothetical protein